MQHYEVVDLIGEGAYGMVLKAKRKEDGCHVAIKKFKQTDDDELIKKTTVRELNVLKSLRHKNIVQLREAFKKKGLVHMVFEYIDNNLLEVLQRNPKGLQNRTIAKYIYQVLEGLDYMHSLNYIHRDIKPQNLLVSTTGTVKICDMGFARLIDPNMTDYVATRWYRPPELLVGSQYGPPIDIWAVGCIMAQLTDTQPLFPGSDQIDQLHQIIKAMGPLPDCLKSILQKNKQMKGLIFPKKKQNINLVQRYRNKITEKGVDLLSKMLDLDPNRRITAHEALRHPYFDIIKPKLHRFQKTSEAWISYKLTSNWAFKENNTERNRKQSSKILTSLETIDYSDKDSVSSRNKQLGFFKFGQKPSELEDTPRRRAPLKSNLVVNKIYRHSDNRKKYLVPYHVSEKHMKKTEESSKCLQTLTNFKISKKKAEYCKNKNI